MFRHICAILREFIHQPDVRGSVHYSTECPTRYRTRQFFNNFTTNEDIATKFEADLPHCVRNVTTANVLRFKFHCNIFIGGKIIKEMPGSVASGTPCIIYKKMQQDATVYKNFFHIYMKLNMFRATHRPSSGA